MSEKLCTLRTKGGGGGKYTETSLWTNPSPSSSFAVQSVSLSESMDNFKYIKVVFKNSTSNTTECAEIITVTDLKKSLASLGTNRVEVAIGSAGSYAAYRRVTYVDNTTINFTNALQISGTGSNTTQVIPLEILGLNELDHGKRFDETVLWTNSASSSTFAAQEITLSDDIDNYDYIAIDYKYANNTSDGDYSTVMQTPANIKKGGYNTSVTRCGLALDYISGGNANYARQVFYVSDTKLRFDIGRQFGGTNSSNANAIPLRVVGCKFR